MSPTVETANGTLPLGESGSAADFNEQIFDEYRDGKIFSSTWDLFERGVDNMLARDGKARALEQVLTLPLRAAPHSLTPAQGDQGEAEWVRETLERPANNGGMSTPLDLVIAQACSAVVYRRAFFEKVWRVDDTGDTVSFDKIAFRPASTCQIIRDPKTRAFQGFRQRVVDDKGATDWVNIAPVKAFVYIHGQHRNPLNGISDLRTAYSIFDAKQKIRFLLYQFLENQVTPKAIAKTRNGNEQAFAKKVATLKGGGVLGISDEDSVEPYQSDGSGAAVFQAAMEYLDHEMFASCLAGFADLAGAAASGRGSFALSKDQSDFFLRSRQAVLAEMAASFTSFVIADLVRWNFGVDAKAPQFSFGDLTSQDAADVISLFQSLATAVTTSPAVPPEFMEMLTELVAEHTGMDVDRVRKAMTERQQQAPASPTDQLTAGIAQAAQLVQEAGVAPTGSSVALSVPHDLAPEPVPAPDPPVVNVDVKPPDVHVHATIERNGGVTLTRDDDGRVTGAVPTD